MYVSMQGRTKKIPERETHQDLRFIPTVTCGGGGGADGGGGGGGGKGADLRHQAN